MKRDHVFKKPNAQLGAPTPAAQIESLVDRMHRIDADFHIEDLTAHLHALHQIRGLGVPGKEG